MGLVDERGIDDIDAGVDLFEIGVRNGEFIEVEVGLAVGVVIAEAEL